MVQVSISNPQRDIEGGNFDAFPYVAPCGCFACRHCRNRLRSAGCRAVAAGHRRLAGYGRRSHRRHRTPPRRTPDRRAGRGFRLFGRSAGRTRRARHHRHCAVGSQRDARSEPRHQLDAVRLHPRHRPAGPRLGLRAGRRHLSRRHLPQPPAGRRPRHLRRRADRSAARSAGHALWAQHHRRRGQVCDQAPAARAFVQGACHLWHLRPGRRRGDRLAPDGRSRASRRFGRAPVTRRFRRKPDHRPRKLQQGHLGWSPQPRSGRL